MQPLLDALDKIRPQLESCRPRAGKTETVKAQFHVAFGKLSLAAPAAQNNGDVNVARCIANRVHTFNPHWKDTEDGILIVEVIVPPR